MLGDQIYIAGLIEAASKTAVGKTWLLDRMKVMTELGLPDQGFDELQLEIEARMPGIWEKTTAADRGTYMYLRVR